ncbi:MULTISPECIES: hypothetical protein [Streptomyces]|uniref:Uncharacterized protein n=2 Tax=Streptomyces TaxID=1883 RepID=A0A3Q9G0G9_STRLT|nr:hypothetical protein [Streptomyces luteoverticillatus]AZQ72706.1 hypothetical protein EKH77_17085 [Streptomyces luteoverticillatus]
MSSDSFDRRLADDDLYRQLNNDIEKYVSDPGHDSEFGTVVLCSLAVESEDRAWGEYPPEGHDYPGKDR